jgi:membrane protease subunit (stomatin/prohibitin family)
MAFILSKSIMSAASTGLMLGALSACGGSAPPAETPEAPSADPAGAADAAGADAAAADAAGAKACCKGMNECGGKGGCKTDANACAGKNECKGKGGCNGHCPK